MVHCLALQLLFIEFQHLIKAIRLSMLSYTLLDNLFWGPDE